MSTSKNIRTNLDFHLTITRAPQGDGYTARVIDSPVGQAAVEFMLPFSGDAVRQLSWRAGFSPRDVKLIKAPTPDAPTLTIDEFGTLLFDAVFAGAVGQLFARSLDAATRDQRNLRIQLQFDDVPEMAELPWEYLYSRDLDRFVALSTRTPLVRYMALAQSERALTVALPLRVLVVVASPSDLPRLDVEAEWTRLNEGVRALVAQGVVEITRLEAATLTALRQQLRRGQFHILHFIGHGDFDAATDEGSLIFEDDTGKQDGVSAKQLATLLHDHATLRLVFLNACQGAASSREQAFAGVAQRLVQQGVPTVLAMQFAVSDRTAIALSHEFYAALSDGLPLESAVAEARKAIYAEGIDFEWGTPVLFTRSPDGVLVALPDTEATEDTSENTPNGKRQSSSFGQLREVHAGGDVVIGNVTNDDGDGDGKGSDARKGSRNVIVGKNNVQINIGGQLMTLPFWLISIALLVVIGILSAPAIEPLFWPSQMSGGMNIAIADFGQIDASGRVSPSPLGATLSKAVFDKLNQEYQEVYPELLGADARSVEIWHDSLGRSVKNLNFGFLAGATPEERAQRAEALAARINAHVVIYGYLIEEGNQNSLHLDFYYAGDTLRGEPDTVVGRHVLSELISFPAALEQEPMAVQEVLNVPLGLRARVLFWVTVALIFDVTDQQERALATLQEAEATLTALDDDDGQALLHYFIGREAFWLREYDVAIAALEEAQTLKPNYANVYIALGAVHYDRGQLFYTPQPIPADLEECISTEHLDRAAQSAEEAMAEIDLAIGYLEQAVAVAPDSPWPPIEFPARLALGHAYRLKGQAFLLGGQPAMGHEWFTKALTEFDLAQGAFADAEQQQYLAWTHLGRAATFQLQAYTELVEVPPDADASLVADKQQAAATLFQQTDEECQHCLDEGKDVADLVYQKKVLRCGCEYLQGLAQTAGVELQKLMEEQ